MESTQQTTYKFHPDNTIPTGDWIWVFGSNLAGRHGKGAARVARVNFRAQYGVGCGPTGRAYAIPTKDAHLAVLPFEDISRSIEEFLQYARSNPAKNFFVTRVGCVLAGNSDEKVGPLFAAAPSNCSLPETWKEFVTERRQTALQRRSESPRPGV